MTAYGTVSVENVIARIIRNIRLTDLTFAQDILEWIGEGVERMEVRYKLEKAAKVLEITDGCERLPCGLRTITGVFYNGRRLRYGTGTTDPRVKPWKALAKESVDSYFVTDTEANIQDYNLIRGLDLRRQDNVVTDDYYITELEFIKTSFDEGDIVLFYTRQPVDPETGYPMIPNIEEAKEALFWYVVSKLVFAGFKLEDARHDYDYCDAKATQFFRKAKNKIKARSIDEKESHLKMWHNLIPPEHYYRNFFINGEQTQQLIK